MNKRVRVFCDFWNFSLTVRTYDSNYRLDWAKLPQVLVREALEEGETGSYEGCHVYASVDSTREADRGLKDFLMNTINTFPGYKVLLFERKPANPPHCRECNSDIIECPHCHKPLKRTIEKGNDTALVTDMLQHAWDDTYDVGVLLSSDRDYIPAVEFLNKRGKKIVHASFIPIRGKELANACWKRVDLSKCANELSRNK